MTVVVITPPAPVVTFEEVSKHLADVPAEDKDYVEALTAAATAWIDGPAGWLGRAIGVQMLELDGCFGCERFRLPIGPVIEIDSIVTDAHADDPITVDPSFYSLRSMDTLVVPTGASWVRQSDHRIRYWAGYGRRDPGDATKWINDAPAPIKVAIMMLVAQWYGTRSGVSIGAAPETMPFAVDALLSPYRNWRV